MMAAPEPGLWRTRLSAAWLRRGWLAWALWPLSLLFGALSVLRRSLYRRGVFKTHRVAAQVVVVGNVVAGGSGKTPVVIAIVQALQARDVAVGVISRGYGRHTQDCREVFVDSRVSEVGDEPALIKYKTNAPVFVADSRFEAACRLLAQHPQTQVIVCDDGLQHYALARDVEICIFDDRGIGNGFWLPAGPLRERWPRAADWVLHTGAQPDVQRIPGFTAQRRLAPQAVNAHGQTVALGTLRGELAGERPGKPLLALAGIAKPEAFFAMLRSQGLVLARTLALPDHYDFDNINVNEYEAYTVICTEKDAQKLWRILPEAWAVGLVFEPEPAFMTALLARLRR